MQNKAPYTKHTIPKKVMLTSKKDQQQDTTHQEYINQIQRTKQDDGNDRDSSVGEQGAAVEQVGEARGDRREVENRVDEPGVKGGSSYLSLLQIDFFQKSKRKVIYLY